MCKMKKLPEAEFEIMKVIWSNEQPITSNTIMKNLGNEKKWKVPTAISLMSRLVEKGFLRTEKIGKERTYYSIIDKEDYMKFETCNFMEHYHESSLINFVNTLYNGKQISEEDIDDLLKWAKDRR